MKSVPWLVMLSLSLVACSGSKSAQKVNEETPQIELSDADEFIENPSEENTAGLAAAEPTIAADEEPADIIETAVSDTNNTTTPAAEPAPAPAVAVMDEAPSRPSVDAGSLKQYTVKKNETLMLIAFNLYGNYERWKELATQNKDLLKGHKNVKEGMVISYLAPAEEFVWNAQGNPYLIRTGDTLGRISNSVYQTPKKWKDLWENNRPLIKNPNRIFAGFTIFWLENGRNTASGI
jgi:nucleoid-associated protein YgaU